MIIEHLIPLCADGYLHVDCAADWLLGLSTRQSVEVMIMLVRNELHNIAEAQRLGNMPELHAADRRALRLLSRLITMPPEHIRPEMFEHFQKVLSSPLFTTVQTVAKDIMQFPIAETWTTLYKAALRHDTDVFGWPKKLRSHVDRSLAVGEPFFMTPEICRRLCDAIQYWLATLPENTLITRISLRLDIEGPRETKDEVRRFLIAIAHVLEKAPSHDNAVQSFWLICQMMPTLVRDVRHGVAWATMHHYVECCRFAATRWSKYFMLMSLGEVRKATRHRIAGILPSVVCKDLEEILMLHSL
jgi:hypothetical protein